MTPSAMTPERRQKVFAVLTVSLNAPPEDRATILARECGADDELRRAVEERLAVADEADDLFSRPLVKLSDSFGLSPGQRLGPYRIEGLLGQGGMGEVYQAVREDDFEKKVAIKLVRGDTATRASTTRRFQVERQILARLEHPAIARILDGGNTEDGRPYLVMEYVDGETVDRYCVAHKLTARQRLQLFSDIADAVAFAHQNLVVHRDLKPGNVLVNQAGVPKLLDFGIAKLLSAPEILSSDTGTGERAPMTPRYASPEQVRNQPVTVATDVYALGLLLYEILVGRLPNGLSVCPPEEIAARICDEPPRPPSAIATQVRRGLNADVDAIVLKALRKDPLQRYASAEQFAADVRRYLGGLPVEARRYTWASRAQKLVRRHTLATFTAAAVTTLAVTSTFFWWQAETARDLAVHENKRAEMVSDFLLNLLRSAEPDQAQGRELTVRELVDAGRVQLEDRSLKEAPEVRARLLGTLGNVYRDLGHYEPARELYEESAVVRRELYPNGHRELIEILNDLASVDYYEENYAVAEARYREVLDLRRRLKHSPGDVAIALNNLASALKQQGQFDAADEIYREALQLREEALGPGDPSIASSLYRLGALRFDRGDLDSAESLLRRALAIRTKAHGDLHSRVITVRSTLGRVLLARGNLPEAEQTLRQALSERQQILDDDHLHVAYSRRDLAELLLAEGDLDGAGALLEKVLAVLRPKSPNSWRLADAEGIYGVWLAAQKRFEEAEPLLEKAYRTMLATKGEDSFPTLEARRRLVLFYETWGHPEKARTISSEAP